MEQTELSNLVLKLEKALAFIRKSSNDWPAWQLIISLYENAIAAAKENRYFSVEDATCIYLEFNDDYTSEIVRVMGEASSECEEFFRDTLTVYVSRFFSKDRVQETVKKLARHEDIYEEIINYILDGEQFAENPAAIVEGYTAKALCEKTILTPLGAFNYLAYLRENPEEALANLKRGLPNKDAIPPV